MLYKCSVHHRCDFSAYGSIQMSHLRIDILHLLLLIKTAAETDAWRKLLLKHFIHGNKNIWGSTFLLFMYLFFNVFNTYTDKIPSTCFKIAYGFVINELNKVCDYTFSDMIKINFSSLGSHPHTLFERLKRKISQTVCQHYVLIIYFNPDIKSIIHFWLHAIEQWEKHTFKILGSFNP